jgi:hypothetical protein
MRLVEAWPTRGGRRTIPAVRVRVGLDDHTDDNPAGDPDIDRVDVS